MKNPPRSNGIFTDALIGVVTAFREEKNMRTHSAALLLLVAVSAYFRLDRLEWALVLLAAGSVICSEIFNTAVERTVDLAEPNFHPLAALAKRLAAGGVLVSVLTALIVGALVFWPRVWAALR